MDLKGTGLRALRLLLFTLAPQLWLGPASAHAQEYEVELVASEELVISDGRLGEAEEKIAELIESASRTLEPSASQKSPVARFIVEIINHLRIGRFWRNASRIAFSSPIGANMAALYFVTHHAEYVFSGVGSWAVLKWGGPGWLAAIVGGSFATDLVFCIPGQLLLRFSPKFRDRWQKIRVKAIRPVLKWRRGEFFSSLYRTYIQERPAMERMFEAFESGSERFSFRAPRELRSNQSVEVKLSYGGNEFLRMHLDPYQSHTHDSDSLALKSIDVDRALIKEIPKEELLNMVGGLGWNVRDAVMVFRDQVVRDRGFSAYEDLFFVGSVYESKDRVRVEFLGTSVNLPPRRSLRPKESRNRIRRIRMAPGGPCAGVFAL